MNNKKIGLILFISIFCFGIGWCQEVDVSAEISKIKLNTDKYLYGEAGGKTEEAAADAARSELTKEIEDWVKRVLPDYKIEEVSVREIESICQVLSYKRTTTYRVCAFVKKEDIHALLPIGRVANEIKVNNRETERSEITANRRLADNDSLKLGQKLKENVVNANSGINYGEPKKSVDSDKSNVSRKINEDKSGSIENDLLRTTSLQEVRRLINSIEYRSNYYYRTIRHSRDLEQVTGGSAILVIYGEKDKLNRAILKYDRSSKTLTNINSKARDSFANYPGCEAIIIQASK